VVAAGPLGEAVVRTFRRGGLVRHVSRQRYLLGDRAFDELLLLERLRRVGAPVPEPLAAVQTRLRPGYAACLVTRRLRGVEPAAQRLRKARSAEVEAILESVGRAVRRLHDAGGRHADLNAWNVLVPVAGPPRPAWVVDLDRGRFDPDGVPRRHRRRNLARLRRSLRKLGLADALAAWPAFERGYASPPEPVPAA
jgi:3-deoxy-D-manno-octulosonic acid kinase